MSRPSPTGKVRRKSDPRKKSDPPPVPQDLQTPGSSGYGSMSGGHSAGHSEVSFSGQADMSFTNMPRTPLSANTPQGLLQPNTPGMPPPGFQDGFNHQFPGMGLGSNINAPPPRHQQPPAPNLMPPKMEPIMKDASLKNSAPPVGGSMDIPPGHPPPPIPNESHGHPHGPPQPPPGGPPGHGLPPHGPPPHGPPPHGPPPHMPPGLNQGHQRLPFEPDPMHDNSPHTSFDSAHDSSLPNDHRSRESNSLRRNFMKDSKRSSSELWQKQGKYSRQQRWEYKDKYREYYDDSRDARYRDHDGPYNDYDNQYHGGRYRGDRYRDDDRDKYSYKDDWREPRYGGRSERYSEEWDEEWGEGAPYRGGHRHDEYNDEGRYDYEGRHDKHRDGHHRSRKHKHKHRHDDYDRDSERHRHRKHRSYDEYDSDREDRKGKGRRKSKDFPLKEAFPTPPPVEPPPTPEPPPPLPVEEPPKPEPEPDHEGPRMLSLESRIQSLLNQSKDPDLRPSTENEPPQPEMTEQPPMPEEEPPPLPDDDAPLPPLPPSEAPPLPPEPEDGGPPMPPSDETYMYVPFDMTSYLEQTTGMNTQCVSVEVATSGKGEEDDRMSLASSNSDEQQKDGGPALPPVSMPGMVSGMLDPFQAFQNNLLNNMANNFGQQAPLVGKTLEGYPPGLAVTAEDQNREKHFMSVLEQVISELKTIVMKDLRKKMVENSAFKSYENWWDQEGDKHKVCCGA